MNKALRPVTVEQLRKVKTAKPHKPFTVACCSAVPAFGTVGLDQALHMLFRALVDHRGVAEASLPEIRPRAKQTKACCV